MVDGSAQGQGQAITGSLPAGEGNFRLLGERRKTRLEMVWEVNWHYEVAAWMHVKTGMLCVSEGIACMSMILVSSLYVGKLLQKEVIDFNTKKKYVSQH